MSTQSGHERPVDANPNPLGTCFCGVLREDCPGGPGFVSPQEIEGVPGNYANYISKACVLRLAGDEREEQALAEPRPDYDPERDHPVPELPEPHVNPTAPTLEEATRLLEEQEADRLDDDGGPVI